MLSIFLGQDNTLACDCFKWEIIPPAGGWSSWSCGQVLNLGIFGWLGLTCLIFILLLSLLLVLFLISFLLYNSHCCKGAGLLYLYLDFGLLFLSLLLNMFSYFGS